MTLDSPSANHSAFSVSSGIVQRAAIFLSIALGIFAASRIRAEYHDFLALGPGGTPCNFAGFLRVKFLGLFALEDRYTAGPILSNSTGQWSHLAGLPQRRRPRPLTKGIAPHRQMNQRSSQTTHLKLAASIEQMAQGDNADLAIGTSCFEKHGTGLFSRSPVTKTCRGEIVHLHGSDGSMHVTLHPNDMKIVLETGWGERHPLAGVFQKWFLPQLPVGFVMLYAPLDEEEIGVVLRIIAAAAAFVNGKEIDSAREFGNGPVEKQQRLGVESCCDVAMSALSVAVVE